MCWFESRAIDAVDWIWVTFLRMFPLEDKTYSKRSWWRVFFHALLDAFRTLFDPTFIFDAIKFGAETSGFQHDLTIQFIFHCEWYFFVCRIEQFVILVIIRQIEQMLEILHIRKEIIGFYSIQQTIMVFVHDFEAISKLRFHFIIMKFVENNFW